MSGRDQESPGVRDPRESGAGLVGMGVFFVALALLMFEILQTVTLSLQIFSGNAFLVISVALFGLGAGGSLASLITRNGNPVSERWLWLVSVAYALGLLVAAILNSRTSGLMLLILFSVGPYLLAGLLFSTVFHRWPSAAGRLYFFNLVGSAFGCAAVVWALDFVGDVGLVHLLITVLALSGSVCFAISVSRRAVGVTVVTGMAVLAISPFGSTLFEYRPSSEKTYGKILADPTRRPTEEWSKWGYLGRLDAVIPRGGVGFAYSDGWVPDTDGGTDSRILFASGDNWTTLVNFKDDDVYRTRFVRQMVPSAPYIFFDDPDVLNIGVGGGVDMFLALAHGAKSVVGVEINPLMLEAIRDRYPDYFDGAARDPRVRLEQIDGRTFVDQSSDTFDVVTLTAVDTGAGLATGAYVLSESYLYTQEAFDSYLGLLEADGVLFAYRPRIQLLRLLTTAVTSLRKLGAPDPSQHIAVFGGGEWVGALIGKNPLSPERRALLEGRLAEGDLGGPLRQPQGETGADSLDGFLEALKEGREAEFIQRFPFAITPVTDDQPFFYHLTSPFAGSVAAKVLTEVLSLVGLAAIVFIFAPLIGFTRFSKDVRWVSSLTYFFAIGMGFMLVEIALIQKLALFLGHPSYSLTVAMFTILVFSGLGSLTVDRFSDISRNIIGAAIIGVALIAIFYSFGLRALLGSLQVESLAGRALIVVALLAPGSFLMGFPFPSMIRRLAGESRPLICWAWGFNSLASVIASIVAVMISMSWGFTATLMAGALGYVIAFGCLWTQTRSQSA